MEPIINPMVFYWIDVLGNLNKGISVFLIMSILPIASLGLASILEGNEFFLKYCKLPVIILIITSLLMIFIPSEKTLYKMVISKNVTSDNIEMVEDKIKDSVDYIFENINK